MAQDLKSLLDQYMHVYQNRKFIENDPIKIPHAFKKKQDIEIAGFLAATLAWGNRKTILAKAEELMDRMHGQPYEFVLNLNTLTFKRLRDFKHRTFNDTDLGYFITFFHHHYQKNDSLEAAFFPDQSYNKPNLSPILQEFKKYFFSLPDYPKRTTKHISAPEAACKRINMFLRWMIRKDEIDFGLWKKIQPSDLISPCDIHVHRIAKLLNITQRTKADWKMAIEITQKMKSLDPEDPVKYDIALFSLGVEKQLNANFQF